jgi:tetratricopeptide (TPR) repeat protein
MNHILFFLMIIFSCVTWSQTSTDQQLANLYFSNGEYAKAITYFEKILTKQSSKFENLRYVECLEKTNQIGQAEKVLKKLVNANEQDVEYAIILGDFYERNAKQELADKLLNERIKSVSKNGYQSVELYNSFIRRGKVQWGLKTLEAARKNLKNEYPLQLQFAEAYSLLGRIDDMINEYFDVLDQSPNSIYNIQSSLSKQIDFQNDANGTYNKLKEKLLVRIQKKPNELVYPEMLIWLFVQKKEFKSAFIQAQAIDKREKGNGNRLLELAETCVQNNDYVTARLCYNSIIAQGTTNPNYFRAYSALLNVRYREITNEKNVPADTIVTAMLEYRKAIQLIGWNRNVISVAKELALIQAYYANDAAGSAALLDSCLQVPGNTDFGKAELKMALADVLVLQDDIWQASLLYMQVDADFKFETIGSEAKFKNARIFYYDGDFKFAQSQLDVLKESTSKLIANDAMKLSVLITDNLGLDSNYTAMNQFAKADLLLEQHQFEKAFQLYDSINQAFPYHGLSDEILMRKAQAMRYLGRWNDAVSYLLKIYTTYREDILADDALFQLGDLYENHLHDKEKAAEYYKKILFECKGSLLTVEARKRFRALRGDLLEEELSE